MKKLFFIAILVLIPSTVFAQYRGPQHFTITKPDGSMASGQYMQDTGQVIMQDQGRVSAWQREPNNNWRQTIQPAPPAWDNLLSGDDGDD